jgi:hypothetical protein
MSEDKKKTKSIAITLLDGVSFIKMRLPVEMVRQTRLIRI